jgi:hypothetical protein
MQVTRDSIVDVAFVPSNLQGSKADASFLGVGIFTSFSFIASGTIMCVDWSFAKTLLNFLIVLTVDEWNTEIMGRKFGNEKRK